MILVSTCRDAALGVDSDGGQINGKVKLLPGEGKVEDVRAGAEEDPEAEVGIACPLCGAVFDLRTGELSACSFFIVFLVFQQQERSGLLSRGFSFVFVVVVRTGTGESRSRPTCPSLSLSSPTIHSPMSGPESPSNHVSVSKT